MAHPNVTKAWKGREPDPYVASFEKERACLPIRSTRFDQLAGLPQPFIPEAINQDPTIEWMKSIYSQARNKEQPRAAHSIPNVRKKKQEDRSPYPHGVWHQPVNAKTTYRFEAKGTKGKRLQEQQETKWRKRNRREGEIPAYALPKPRKKANNH